MTARALDRYAADVDRVTVVHVVERADGTPADAGGEGGEGVIDESHAAFEAVLDGPTVESRRVFDEDVVDGILETAAATGSTAVVFSPREGGRLVRYLSGDVALRLVTESPVPVVSLPRADESR